MKKSRSFYHMIGFSLPSLPAGQILETDRHAYTHTVVSFQP